MHRVRSSDATTTVASYDEKDCSRRRHLGMCKPPSRVQFLADCRNVVVDGARRDHVRLKELIGRNHATVVQSIQALQSELREVLHVLKAQA
jgi:hypothetical protein